MIDKQKVQKTIDFLREYNKWRRGQLKKEPINATTVGESIDYLIDLVSTEILKQH